MARRAAVALVLLVVALAATLCAPHPAAAQGLAEPQNQPAGRAGSSAVDAIEGQGMLCLMHPTAENCRLSKGMSAAHSYPLSHWEIDDYAESDTFDPSTWFPAVMQWLNTTIWYALLKLVDGVLSLLAWAFNLRLIGSPEDVASAQGGGWISDNELGSTLRQILNALGGSWMVLGIMVAAGWGIWNGLVRQRTIQTLGGLAATFALMVTALVLITAPGQTIGKLSKTIDDSAKAGFAIASTGSPTHIDQAELDAHSGLWRALIEGPWCALEFGDVNKCKETADWDNIPGKETLAEGYLKHPIFETVGWLAPSADSDPVYGVRMIAYQKLRQQGGGWSRLQELDGSLPRFGLLLLIAGGLIGAIAVLLSVGIKLIFASVEVLVLMLFLPVMLIAPAFGEAGRNATLWYGRRLFERTIAKWVYAIYVGVVVLGNSLIASLDLSFYDRWWLMLAYWWGMFLKRHEILGMLFLDPEGRQSGARGRGGTGLFGFAMGYRAARQMVGDVGRLGRRAAGGAVAGPRALGGVLQRRHDRHGEAVGRAYAGEAREQLRERFAQQHQNRRARAQAAFDEKQRKMHELRGIERQQQQLRKQRGDLLHKQRMNPPDRKRNPTSDPLKTKLGDLDRKDAKLHEDAETLRAELADPRYGNAERFLSQHSNGPYVMDQREFNAAVERREAELRQAWDSDANLIAAGVDPDDYRANIAASQGTTGYADASRQEVARMEAQAQRVHQHDSALIASLRDGHGQFYRDLPGAGTGDPREDYRAARRQIREERSERQARDRIFRR